MVSNGARMIVTSMVRSVTSVVDGIFFALGLIVVVRSGNTVEATGAKAV